MTPSDQTLARDPVCGMSVNPATAKHAYEHAGKNYYFCCAHCVEKFKADPQGYLDKPASSGLVMVGMPAVKPVPHAAAATIQPAPPEVREPAKASKSEFPAYVCPMCPEVRESKPGACLSCGMALEPEVPVSATRIEYTCPMHPEIVRSE